MRGAIVKAGLTVLYSTEKPLQILRNDKLYPTKFIQTVHVTFSN